MSVTFAFSSLYCFGNTSSTKLHAVPCPVISTDIIECNNMDCTIEKPDFVISENEKLDVTDLQRHGLKVTRNYRIYDQEKATVLTDMINRAENTPLYECRMIFPEKLTEGKNRIEIQSFSPFDYFSNIRCSLQINVTFSENSEKKDLCTRAETLFGDLDGNKTVDSKDLLTLSLFLLDRTDVTAGQYMSADVSGDGEVDISDLALLRQYIMKEDIDLGKTKRSDDDIVFIRVYSGGGMTYRYYGTFYDKQGNEYRFDFTDHFHYLTDDELLDRIRKIYHTASCTDNHKLDEEEMTYINSLIYKIDPENEFDENHEMCDFGEIEFYGVKHNDDHTDELVKVYSFGDTRYTPKDINAAEIYRYYCEAAEIADDGMLIQYTFQKN